MSSNKSPGKSDSTPPKATTAAKPSSKTSQKPSRSSSRSASAVSSGLSAFSATVGGARPTVDSKTAPAPLRSSTFGSSSTTTTETFSGTFGPAIVLMSSTPSAAVASSVFDAPSQIKTSVGPSSVASASSGGAPSIFDGANSSTEEPAPTGRQDKLPGPGTTASSSRSRGSSLAPGDSASVFSASSSVPSSSGTLSTAAAAAGSNAAKRTQVFQKNYQKQILPAKVPTPAVKSTATGEPIRLRSEKSEPSLRLDAASLDSNSGSSSIISKSTKPPPAAPSTTASLAFGPEPSDSSSVHNPSWNFGTTAEEESSEEDGELDKIRFELGLIHAQPEAMPPFNGLSDLLIWAFLFVFDLWAFGLALVLLFGCGPTVSRR